MQPTMTFGVGPLELNGAAVDGAMMNFGLAVSALASVFAILA